MNFEIKNLKETIGIDGLKEYYNKLSMEAKKYLIFSLSLEAKDLDECEKIIKLLDEEKYYKYTKQLFLGQTSKMLETSRIKMKNFFEDSQYNYRNILNKFKILVKELKLTNSLEISILYTYLMWNGYFSKEKIFNYQIEKRALIEGMYSYDIMNGNGVCLNFSDMLKDILIECGYNSSILINKVEKQKELKKFYIPEINRSVIKSHNPIAEVLPLIFKPLINKMGNHAFNLIEENGKLYIYDSTNLCFLELTNPTSAILLAGKGKFKLTPYFSYLLNGEKERKSLDTLCLTDNFSSPYDRKDYIITSEKCIDLFNKSESLLNDYHNDINSDILSIVNSVDYYKQNKKKILKSIN